MIILVAGRSKSGKDTFAQILKNVSPSLNFEILHFADNLKKDVAEMNNISVEYLEKNKEIYRKQLQTYSTEKKTQYSNNYWADSLSYSIKHNKNYIIADLRYQYELDRISKLKYRHKIFSVRIYRKESDEKPVLHDSEEINLTADLNISNNGSKNELQEIILLLSKGL